ncbi:hypothetical protein TNCV_1355471 [Trichonephila clavipes]|uniref:Uncharacterized protein n=1 Tax=Trichonephila clavipes TaxID=2585209 RepID=A0A8X6VD18_TRICX|nr:hypothetical protein TNCV_1355471 [Trichonephila clavipes]
MFSELKLCNEIKNVLEDLTEDNIHARVTAEGLRKSLESFHTTLLTMIWNEILQRVDQTMQLNKRRDCYEVLKTRFEIFRNLHEKEHEETTKQVKYLVLNCPKDIDEEQFVQESVSISKDR